MCARWVPHLLTIDQKNERVIISERNLDLLKKKKDFFRSLVTCDETWVPFYLSERKEKTKEWRKKEENYPIKVKENRFEKKIMLIIFWDMTGIFFSSL